jgi:hypothetical protein
MLNKPLAISQAGGLMVCRVAQHVSLRSGSTDVLGTLVMVLLDNPGSVGTAIIGLGLHA